VKPHVREIITSIVIRPMAPPITRAGRQGIRAAWRTAGRAMSVMVARWHQQIAAENRRSVRPAGRCHRPADLFCLFLVILVVLTRGEMIIKHVTRHE
jgi:hypothetical protein